MVNKQGEDIYRKLRHIVSTLQTVKVDFFFNSLLFIIQASQAQTVSVFEKLYLQNLIFEIP